MDLRHLRAFIAVAEEMHFGRAGERLHLSPPPISTAIKELETELGVQLFERSLRRITLTRSGQELLRDARNIVARTEAMRSHASRMAKGLLGSLSVGFISTAAYSFLPDLLSRFTSDHPEVRLTLHEKSSDRVLVDLESGALDVGFLFASPGSFPALSYDATNRFRLVVALAESHPLARLKKVPLERLADERFLLFERQQGPLMFDKIVAACMHHGFSPRIFHARQQHTIVSLISASFGVALVPECVQVMRRDGVVYRPLRGDSPVIEVGAAWRTDDDSPTLKAFLEYVPRLQA